MQNFDWMLDNPFFKEKKEHYIRYVGYVFETKLEIAEIRVPKKASFELKWFHQPIGVSYPNLTSHLEDTPFWFQELVLQTHEQVKRRDRIRNLFQ